MKLTKAEKMMMEGIDEWIKSMNYYTNAQYGKGKLIDLYRKVAEEVMTRQV